MIPVQYRDPETEEILDGRYEEGTPPIGAQVRIGYEQFEVLYRWRCAPIACVVYVRPVTEKVGAAA